MMFEVYLLSLFLYIPSLLNRALVLRADPVRLLPSWHKVRLPIRVDTWIKFQEPQRYECTEILLDSARTSFDSSQSRICTYTSTFNITVLLTFSWMSQLDNLVMAWQCIKGQPEPLSNMNEKVLPDRRRRSPYQFYYKGWPILLLW
jgi:hypothetical protein